MQVSNDHDEFSSRDHHRSTDDAPMQQCRKMPVLVLRMFV
jgi:hypothetical protein